MFKPADISKLSDALPALAFDIEKDEKNTQKPATQFYLKHYKINFAQTLPNVRHGFGSFEASGFTIATHYWLPAIPKGTIFVLHGYFDHVGLFAHLIRFSLQNDYAVVAYDLPGMGLSSGEPATIDSFDRYYDVFETCLNRFKSVAPQPWHCVAQSAGSTAVIQHLIEQGQSPLSKIVLLAPLVRSLGWPRDLWLYRFGRFFINSLPRKFTKNSHDEEFLKFLKESDPLQYRRLPVRWAGAMKNWISYVNQLPVSDVSLLIIQGEDDSTVDWNYNVPLLQKIFPKAVVRTIPQARHHLVAESAPYRAQVFAGLKTWFDRQN